MEVVIQVAMVDDGGQRGSIEGEEDRPQDKTLRDATGKFDRIGLYVFDKQQNACPDTSTTTKQKKNKLYLATVIKHKRFFAIDWLN